MVGNVNNNEKQDEQRGYGMWNWVLVYILSIVIHRIFKLGKQKVTPERP